MQQSGNQKIYLKPDQWFNDSRYNLIIRPKGVLDPACKSEYKVQSLIFQMRSPFLSKQIEKLYSECGREAPILELPESFNHGVYEDIHMEIMGYQLRRVKKERILDYYYICFWLQMEEKNKYLKFIFEDIQNSTSSAFVFKAYVLACKLKDEDLRDEIMKFLESKSFRPLLNSEKEEEEVKKSLKELSEDDFKFLIKIHNDRKQSANSERQQEFLAQHETFTLSRKFASVKGLTPEKTRALCKELLVISQLNSEDYEIISKAKLFVPREESHMLQSIFKKKFGVLKKESELIRSQVPKLENEILELRQRLENLGGITYPKVYQSYVETFDVIGHDYLVIAKLDLPKGKYLLTITFFGKHKHANQSMYWMYLYLYKKGINLSSYPNSGWYGYNSNAAYSSPYELVNKIVVDDEMETIEFKGYSGASYDANLTKIHLVAKEIVEDVVVRGTPGGRE